LNFEQISGGVTAPKGFKASGVRCGLKKINKKDLAIVFSEAQAQSAGVFTRNTIAAAPVVVSKKHLSSGLCRAVVINSGCANAFTGQRGLENSVSMAKSVAAKLDIENRDVLVASTGVIGEFLPMDKIEKGIAQACRELSASGDSDAAEAIMTTDTFSKQVAVEFQLAGNTVRVGAMAKGAGMIAPNMATMLAFITTDIKIDHLLLRTCLKEAVAKSFNMITVDGETSTNDMVIVLANGLSEVSLADTDTGSGIFKEALEFVCSALAKMIVRDGEGATKFVELTVKGANNSEEARQIGMAIANSILVKTAFYGEDANLGRIIAAAGHAGVDIDSMQVELFFSSEKVAEAGAYLDFDASKVNLALKEKEFEFTVVIGKGPGEATIWTTDLSHEYVDINAHYRT